MSQRRGLKGKKGRLKNWKNTTRPSNFSVVNDLDPANNATYFRRSEEDDIRIRETTASIVRANSCCDTCGSEGTLAALMNGKGFVTLFVACKQLCDKEKSDWIKYNKNLMVLILEMPISLKFRESTIPKDQLRRSNTQENVATATMKRDENELKMENLEATLKAHEKKTQAKK